MTRPPNYYKELGIPVTATEPEIREAIAEKEKRWTRLRSEFINDALLGEALRSLEVLAEAKRSLLDPAARAEYNHLLNPAAAEIAQAQTCEQANDFTGAFGCWQAAADKAPDDPVVWLGLSRTALMTDADAPADAITAAAFALQLLRSGDSDDDNLKDEANALYRQASAELERELFRPGRGARPFKRSQVRPPAQAGPTRSRKRFPRWLVVASSAAVLSLAAWTASALTATWKRQSGASPTPALAAPSHEGALSESVARFSSSPAGSFPTAVPDSSRAASGTYCAELAIFVQRWGDSSELSDPIELSELIAASQQVADSAPAEVADLWEDLLTEYRKAEELLMANQLSKNKETRLADINSRIDNFAADIDARNAIICVGTDP
jgi:tetratricopeptide (TPR) repeat protein